MGIPLGAAVLEFSTDSGALAAGVQRIKGQVAQLGEAASKASRGVDGISRSTGSFTSSLGLLGGALTGTALLGFTTKLVNVADTLSNLSARTALSTTSLQKFQLVFEPAGVSIETVAKAATELSSRLVGGDKGTVAALGKLGLSAEALKKSSPEEMLFKVGDAVGGLQNQAEKIYASKTLFGKSGVELLQGLDGHLEETSKKFEAMGLIIDEKTVKAADTFGDQLGLMGKQLLGVMANAIGPMLPALTALGSGLGSVAKIAGGVLGLAMKGVTEVILGVWQAIATLLGGLADLAQRVPVVGKHLQFLAGASDWLHASAAKAGDMLNEVAFGTAKTGDAAKTATPGLIGLGESLDKTASSAAKLVDTLSGAGLVQKAEAWVAAIAKIGGIGRLTHDELEGFTKDITAAVEKMRVMGQEVPVTWALIADSVENSKLLEHTQAQIGESMKLLDQYQSKLALVANTNPNPAAFSMPAPQTAPDPGATSQLGKLHDVQDAFSLMGTKTRAELQETAAASAKAYETIKASGLATAAELQQAWDRSQAAQRAASGQTAQAWVQNAQTVLDGAAQIFTALGSKYKKAAIAGAIISTYSAIAKALAATPWPFNLVAAAGAAAAGWANVEAIRGADEGFRVGTPDLDYRNFGQRRTVELHGEEAVIPRGRGHVLAEEIAAALPRRGFMSRPLEIPSRTPWQRAPTAAAFNMPRPAYSVPVTAMPSIRPMDLPDLRRPAVTMANTTPQPPPTAAPPIYQDSTIHVHFHGATDAASTRRTFQREILPEIKAALRDNRDSLVGSIKRAIND